MPHNFTLPYPPTVNSYWRHVVIKGQARTLISKQGREYKQAVARALFRHVARHGQLQGRLSMIILATMPDRRKRDIDNITKSLLDSMGAAGVYEDDSQIDEIHIVRKGVEKGGKVEISISELPKYDKAI